MTSRHPPSVPRLVPLVVLLAGCYAPKVTSPGYYCHPADNPACPGDQVCIDGRCINRSEALHFDLAGVTDGPAPGMDAAGGPTDLARADFAKPADLALKDSNGGSCGVKINELETAGAAGATDEFVELYNSCGASTSLSGYKLVYRSASGTSNLDLVTFGSVSINASGFFVCGGPMFSGTANATYTTTSMAAAGGGVALLDGSGAIVDSVGYGTATNAFVKGSPAPAPGASQSIGRLPDGHDSGNNGNDFTVGAMLTPGAINQ